MFQALLVSKKTEKEKGHEMSLEGDYKIKHIQYESIVYNPVSKTAVKSGEKNRFRKLSNYLIDVGAVSVLYRSTAPVSLKICVIENDTQLLHLLSEFSPSFCV